MSIKYYRKYDLDGRTYGVVYEDSSNNFGAVLALRDDGELEPKVSTLKYLNYIISKEGIEASITRSSNIGECIVLSKGKQFSWIRDLWNYVYLDLQLRGVTVSQFEDEFGYSDTYYHEGVYYSFPPNAVIPEKIFLWD